jgi:chromosome partitioning protein
MVGKVLVAATGKGGAGKSTTVAALAIHWHQSGRKVALLDADQNQTLTRWHAKKGALSEVTLRTQSDEQKIIPAISELIEDHDLVLVDCAGFGNQAMVFAIGAADLVLIPVMSDEANIFEALRTIKLVESASRLTRRPIPARTVLTRTRRANVSVHARKQLAAHNAQPLMAEIGDRAIFQEATFHGSSPTELAPRSQAARDVRALAQELDELDW